MMATKKHYGFVIDVARCIDCRACLVACSVENRVPMNQTRIWVQDLGVQGDYPVLQHSFVPYNCMHCENPPCVEVCVSSATYKNPDNGLVLVDQDACIGCGFCVDACPYKVRYLDEKRGVVDKCNGCIQRVEVGQSPACVATCVGGSRMFGDLNDPNSEVSKALSQAKSIVRLDYEANEHDTDPNIYYINMEPTQTLVMWNDQRQPLVTASGQLPLPPTYTLSEMAWKKVAVPVMAAAVGGAFLVQAIYFTKQLIQGEKEFEE
jgi:tetrathionate reductase subunit B